MLVSFGVKEGEYYIQICVYCFPQNFDIGNRSTDVIQFGAN